MGAFIFILFYTLVYSNPLLKFLLRISILYTYITDMYYSSIWLFFIICKRNLSLKRDLVISVVLSMTCLQLNKRNTIFRCGRLYITWHLGNQATGFSFKSLHKGFCECIKSNMSDTYYYTLWHFNLFSYVTWQTREIKNQFQITVLHCFWILPDTGLKYPFMRYFILN